MAASLIRHSAKIQSRLPRHLRSSSSYIRKCYASNAHSDEFTAQKQTHFGFQAVPEEEKQDKVNEVFENVAGSYDLMNDVMSGGIHRLWKDYFMSRLSPTAGTKLIDVAGGTGLDCSPYPNPQPGGPVSVIMSDLYPLTLPGDESPVGIALWVIEVHKPPINDKAALVEKVLNEILKRDIAFRFLQYIQSQSPSGQNDSVQEDDFDIHMPREVEAQVYMDLGKNQPDSSSSSSSDEEDNSGDRRKHSHSGGGGSNSRRSHVTVCDINQAMLDVGKDRAEKQGLVSGISWVQGNAESLPFQESTFDAYTIAFGIRNCTNVQQVVDEAFRVLKPGGRFMCLEFSQVTNPLLRSAYDSYSFNVIPVMGQVIARDWKSYQYLVESIRQFPDQDEFSDMIRRSGFRMVTYENLTFGVAAIHSGFKLLR